ncbi:arylamine N-acetyltransferase family protein [Kordiimonas marina]|uniref:arylamine N-acetyltransferase family protein n=1 Tax=Kordiimonas marina TaxID=2872312 RepID=UPI001FF19BC7|nr:arylamine N-acetyltransferase [Kordiimonas marina]MCJ9430522.1 arylamine N-acetyltransferase [Kordiimonas marina]
MQLDSYLTHIGFTGKPGTDLATLRQIHRLHAETIPYENLDVLARVPLGTDVGAAYDKIVGHKRGGWCYEMNGLLGWALSSIGFAVTPVAAGVDRASRGDSSVGGHLALLIDLDGQRYLADVGFGDGLMEPAPLKEGPFTQGQWTFRLEKLDGAWWRFHNHPEGAAPSFDFTEETASPALMAEKCQFQQTSPLSPFVENAVCQRHFPDRLEVMRGRVLKTVRAGDVASRRIADIDDYRQTLMTLFGIEVDALEPIWQKILKRDAELFPEDQ